MKSLITTLYLGFVLTILTGCGDSPRRDPNHAASDHGHSQAADAGHGHSHDDASDAHNHATETDTHGHVHTEETDDHGHAHTDNEHGHAHAAETEEHGDAHSDLDHAEAEHDHAHEDEHDTATDEEWQKLVGLKTVPVRFGPMAESFTVPGKIIPDPDRVAIISPMMDVSVNRVLVSIGEIVTKNQELVCLASPELGMMRAEYEKAQSELILQKQNLKRKQKLHDENIISSSAYQEAVTALEAAQVSHDYARKRLLSIGLLESALDDPPSEHAESPGANLHIHAPISGVVTYRNAMPGQKVGPGEKILEVMDLGEVWCEASIFEKDLPKVRTGQKITLSPTAVSDQYFAGSLFHVGNTVDEATRTVTVITRINNADRALRPGMFADVHLITGEKPDVLAVPEACILMDEGLPVVFVKEEADFHRHVVTTGIKSEGWVEITSGLEQGSRVVSEGQYQLLAKQQMQGIDPHAGHAH